MRLTRFICYLVISFVNKNINAQPDSIILKQSAEKLNDYLLKKDTVQLKTLITNTLTYGHSNGWTQNNRSLIADLYNGKLNYTKSNQEITGIAIENNTASVKAMAYVEGLVDGKPFAMKLQILQVWVKTARQQWKLFARQSVKLL